MIEYLIKFLNDKIFHTMTNKDFDDVAVNYAILVKGEDYIPKFMELKNTEEWRRDLYGIRSWLRYKIDMGMRTGSLVFDQFELSTLFDHVDSKMVLKNGKVEFIGDDKLCLVNVLKDIDLSKFGTCLYCKDYFYQNEAHASMFCCDSHYKLYKIKYPK